MSRDVNGNYSLPAGNPVVAGTLVEDTWANTTMNDLATAMEDSLSRSGKGAMLASLRAFAGVIGTPGYSWSLEPTSGLYRAGAGDFRYAVSATDILKVTSAGLEVQKALNLSAGANIASAATVNLTTATGNLVHITGVVAITAVTLGSGMMRQVIFDGVLTLTHHATNNNLPGAANITTAAGDRALYWSDGTTVYCVAYFRANGTPVVTTFTTGMIMLWSGTIATIPSGWALCNGAGGTPDLRDRFIVGASSDDVGVAKTNITGALTVSGGSKDAINVSHTHTATVTDPGHSHTIAHEFIGNIDGGGAFIYQIARAGSTSTSTATTGITVANSTEGSSGSNANLPPYYALAYIMKT
jgi:hypothetical protein